jgi:hypothetical protein
MMDKILPPNLSIFLYGVFFILNFIFLLFNNDLIEKFFWKIFDLSCTFLVILTTNISVTTQQQ